MNDDQNGELERRLSGRTLQVYLYLQKKRDAGIREVQRDLGLSSPSVAEYQVEKLVEMGLAGRDSYGRVFVTKKVKVKAMASYVNLGRFAVPRLAFYAGIFTAVVALYVTFNFNSLNVYGVAVPAGAAAIFWFEAWKQWKYSLFEKARKPAEKDYFWISLMPGLAAVAAFIAVVFFLFYYFEPASQAFDGPSAINPSAPLPPSSGSPVKAEDIPVADHGRTAELFWNGLSTSNSMVLLTLGALAAGFVVYVMLEYRPAGRVLAPEQNWN
jgi:hypothetical protein